MSLKSRYVVALELATIVVIVMVAGCAHMNVGLDQLMTADRSPQSARLGPQYVVEEQVLATAEGPIGVTYAHRPGNSTLILFCGGDVFHRSIEGGAVLELLVRDADVVLFDYPGYGDTAGPQSIERIFRTALAVYDYAFSRKVMVDRKRVVYGFSLGGFVAPYLARERRVDGLVLEATAPNVPSWVASQVPWFAKPFVRVDISQDLLTLDGVEALRNYTGRVLLLAGGKDRQAPAGLSKQIEKRLQEAGRAVRYVEFPTAGHGEISSLPEFQLTLASFLAEL